jgi:hypothetical protein
MQMTVDADAVTLLRQVVMRVCGDTLEFMRIEACAHGSRMKVCLCIARASARPIMDEVMRILPGAEFGRFADAPPRHVGARAVRSAKGLQ